MNWLELIHSPISPVEIRILLIKPKQNLYTLFLINREWYGMFVALDVKGLADVSSTDSFAKVDRSRLVMGKLVFKSSGV